MPSHPDESRFVHLASHCVSGIQHGMEGTAGPPEMRLEENRAVPRQPFPTFSVRHFGETEARKGAAAVEPSHQQTGSGM